MHDSLVMEKVRAYITENFLYARQDVLLNENDSLLERGIIDSMGVMELVTFIDGEFGVVAGDEEITEENFGTLAAITRYVASKRTQGAKVA